MSEWSNGDGAKLEMAMGAEEHKKTRLQTPEGGFDSMLELLGERKTQGKYVVYSNGLRLQRKLLKSYIFSMKLVLQ